LCESPHPSLPPSSSFHACMCAELHNYVSNPLPSLFCLTSIPNTPSRSAVARGVSFQSGAFPITGGGGGGFVPVLRGRQRVEFGPSFALKPCLAALSLSHPPPPSFLPSIFIFILPYSPIGPCYQTGVNWTAGVPGGGAWVTVVATLQHRGTTLVMMGGTIELVVKLGKFAELLCCVSATATYIS
jgi:hypothetical protein